MHSTSTHCGDVLLYGPCGAGYVLASTASTMKKVSDSVHVGFIAPDGNSILATNSRRDLERIGGGASHKIATNVQRFVPSHDAAHVAHSASGTTASAIVLASTTEAAPGTTVAPDATHWAFTRDDSHLVYLHSTKGLGAYPTAGGATRELATDVGEFLVAAGARAVICRNTRELLVANLATPDAPKNFELGVIGRGVAFKRRAVYASPSPAWRA